jgi:D-aminoacyl-tRNA deacylase
MRAVVQRVSRAAVRVGDETTGAIGAGLCVLAAAGPADTEADARWMAAKLAHLRIFEDDQGKMNRSLLETGGALLLVSQFTLYADLARGRRPYFGGAAPPAQAVPLLEALQRALEGLGLRVETGRFGAMMAVELVNDGPVTLVIDSAEAT